MDSDPGGKKHADPEDPDPQHCLKARRFDSVFAYLYTKIT
jgi:hypothetical protein